MFFTHKVFAGLYLTKKGAHLAFLSFQSEKKVSFITAERCSRESLKFSKEIVALSRQCPALFSTLPKEKTLTKVVDIPKIKQSERIKLAEMLLCSGGLFEKESLTFAFCDAPGATHLFCTRSEAILDYLDTCGKIGYVPTGLTMPFQALVNFARFICHLEEGNFLHLDEDEGIFVEISGAQMKSARSFSFEMGSKESLAVNLRVSLGDGGSGMIWVTGVGALDGALINYLQAAFGRAFQRPKIDQVGAPAQLCHTFALAVGCAIEASKKPHDQINFRTGRFASRRLHLRGLAQEGFLALHLAAVLVSGFFVANTVMDRYGALFDEQLLKEELIQLQEKTKDLPHGLISKRAGTRMSELDRSATNFQYVYKRD